MVRFQRSLPAIACGLFLAVGLFATGCAQDRPTPVTVAPDSAKTVVDVDSPAITEPVESEQPAPSARGDKISNPLAPLDASCAVDSDCAVKDVGNCCGRMPACVNREATPFDAAAMKRECERTGTSSICGFQELSGCRCEAGQCAGIPSVSGGGDVR